MAVAQRRTSKTRKNMRRTHFKLFAKTTTECPNCKAVIKPHRVCSECGFYKGKEVVKSTDIEETKEK